MASGGGRQGGLAILILEYVSSCPLQTCTINGREANYGWLLALVFDFWDISRQIPLVDKSKSL